MEVELADSGGASSSGEFVAVTPALADPQFDEISEVPRTVTLPGEPSAEDRHRIS